MTAFHDAFDAVIERTILPWARQHGWREVRRWAYDKPGRGALCGELGFEAGGLGWIVERNEEGRWIVMVTANGYDELDPRRALLQYIMIAADPGSPKKLLEFRLASAEDVVADLEQYAPRAIALRKTRGVDGFSDLIEAARGLLRGRH